VPTPHLAFSRTVGDEIQGVVSHAHEAIALARHILRARDWYIGIGVAPIEGALPKRSAEANGPAFVYAREAVEDAKISRGTAPVAVRASNSEVAAHAQGLLQLLGRIYEGRSPAAWEAIDQLVAPTGFPTGFNQRDVALTLRVSPPAVSKRLRAAYFDEEQAVLPLLRALLEQLDESVTG